MERTDLKFPLALALLALLGAAFPALGGPKAHSPYVKEGTDANYVELVEKSKLPVLVDFWAPWCGPCRYFGPMVERAAEKYKGKLRVVKVNVDENQGLSRRFSVQGIPTSLFYKDGKIVHRFSGAPRREEDFQDFVAEFLKE